MFMQEKGIINSFSDGKKVCLVNDKTAQLTRFLQSF